MNKQTICTIITGDYGHYAMALYDSIKEYNEDIIFSIFISQGKLSTKLENICAKNNKIRVYDEKDVASYEIAKKLKKKYKDTNHDAYRWGLKPVFINHLLSCDFEKVIYVDSDIYFFNDYNFLFSELDDCNVLLSPHWRSSDPIIDQENFKLNFRDGIFNGGFIAANNQGIQAMSYWAELCLYNCEVNREQGFYDDQRYLDILPTRFDNVGYIKHKGCNIANWNQIDCKRVKTTNDDVLINNKYPIIFIHFTNSFFRGVLKGNDSVLMPFLEKYKNAILKYDNINVIEKYFKVGKFQKERFDSSITKPSKLSITTLVKNKLRKLIQ